MGARGKGQAPIPTEYQGPKAAVTMAQRRALGRAGLWLRVPGAAQMPADPLRRFEFRLELLRAAERIASRQLYHLELELGAVARANPRYSLSRRLIHFGDHTPTGQLWPGRGHDEAMRRRKHEIAAAARQIDSDRPPARRRRPESSGEAWLRRQLEGLGQREGA